MPAKAASLRITDKYRARMIAIRNRAKSQAKQVWRQVDADDLDGTYQPAILALSISGLQREAARLSAGYLAAFVASELGEPAQLPIANVEAGVAHSGVDLAVALQGPMIGVKVDIKEGKEPALALVEGGRRLTRTAGLATDMAAREALRVAMELSDDVSGYKRAIKGTCPACIGAAEGSTLPAGTPLEIHPDCQCVSEPEVGPRQPSPQSQNRTLTLDEQRALDDYAMGATPNERLRAGAKIPSDGQVPDLERVIADNGEQAPVLHRFLDMNSLSKTDQKKLLTPGETFRDKAFASTTSDRKWAYQIVDEKIYTDIQVASNAKFAFLEIRGDVKALDMQKWANGDFIEEQSEWLLQRSTDLVVKKAGWVTIEGKRYRRITVTGRS